MSSSVARLLAKSEDDIRRYAAELGAKGLERLLIELDETIHRLNLNAGQARTADSAEAVRLASLALSMVKTSDDPSLKAEGHRLMAYVLNGNEEYNDAIPHYTDAIGLLEG